MAIRCAVLLLFVAGVFAGPLNYNFGDSTQCALTCPEGTKFSYGPGKTYEYSYESDVKTSMPGSSEDHSSLHMRATVSIEVTSPCEMVLKLTDLSLQDSNPEQYEQRQHVDNAYEFKRALEEKPLRFAFVDGRIETICPENEETWVLNIKRGILSAFQNSQSDLDVSMQIREQDISGDCPVSYQVDSSNGRTVKKIKDVLACKERHGHQTAFQGTPYEASSSIQSLPLMKSTHECEQVISSNGIMMSSMCEESHIFRPFSKYSNGATTEVSYRLNFNRESRGVRSTESSVGTRSTLLFDHTITPEEMMTNVREAKKIVNQMCKLMTDDVRPEIPSMFSELVRKMRSLDSNSLVDLHSGIEGMCDAAEKFYHDAIPLLGSTASTRVITELIQTGEVKDSEAELWLTSLAFITNPTPEMFREIKPLLSSVDLKVLTRATLSVTSMVNTYCRVDSECEEVSEVKAIIQILQDNLNYNCKSSSDEQHQKIIVALKGLGNAGHASSAVPTIARCMMNDELDTETRVTAIYATRRMPCKADRSKLFALLKSNEVDSEVRINAYLMLMKCADQSVIDEVISVYESNEVNQVASFIWTHFTNIQESNAPDKQAIRELIEDIELKPMDMDKRKFSRNMEWSIFSEMMNTGAAVDTNLIWSPSSYVPRSASMNLTTDFFGHSINLLELGGRVEGIEGLLEKYLANKDVLDLASREKRSADYNFDVRDESDPKFSYFMKIFGNEIRYGDFHGLDLDQLKDNFNFLDWLIELAKNHEVEYTKSVMFLDSSMTIPTAVGLPLKLSADGTTTFNIKVNGKMDIRQMFTSPSTFDIDGTIKPSAALEVTMSMGVDAHVSKTGLKMVSTLHTSTVTSGKLQLQDGKVLHVDIKMPQEQIEVFNAESKFFVTYRDQERQQTGTNKKVEMKKCFEMKRALGVEACGEISYPTVAEGEAPWFPFTGPVSAKVNIYKRDQYSKFHMDAKLVRDKRTGTDMVRFSVDTPGSRVDREYTVEATVNRKDLTAQLNLKTPWKRAEFEGTITNEDDLKAFNAKATIDEKRVYELDTSVSSAKNNKGAVTYTPAIKLTRPGQTPITLEGAVLVKDGKKYEMDMSLNNMFVDPVAFKGAYSAVDNKKKGSYEVSFDVQSSVLKSKLTAFVDMNRAKGNSASSRVELTYNYKNNDQERIVISNKIRDRSSDSLMQYSVDSSIENSMWPKYNAEMSLAFTKGRDAISASLDAGFDKKRRITITQTSKFSFQKKEKTLEGSVQVKFPPKNFDYTVNVDHWNTMDALKSNAALIKGSKELATFAADISKSNAKFLNFNADIKASYPGRDIQIRETLEEVQPQQYKNNIIINPDKYTEFSMISTLKAYPRYELESTLNIPDFKPIKLDAHLNPVLDNFESRAEVKYEGSTYAVEANFDKTGSLRAFTTKAFVSVERPSRTIHTTVEATRKGAIVSANLDHQWNVNRDASMRFIVDTAVTVNKYKPAITFKTEWPNAFVQVNGEGNYEAGNWYSNEQDISGSLEVKTSFQGFEEFGGKFEHDMSTSQIKTNGEVRYSKNKVISGDMTLSKDAKWRNAQATVNVNTPFAPFRRVILTGDYDVTRTRKTTNMNFQWDRNTMTLSMAGEMNPDWKNMDGEIKFTSPFRYYEQLTISGSHQNNGRVYTTKLETSWDTRSKITFTSKQTKNFSDKVYAFESETTITTPFDGYRSATELYKFNWDSDSMSFNRDLNVDGNQRNFDMEGNYMNNYRQFMISGKVEGSSEVGTYKMDFSHEHDKKFTTMTTKASTSMNNEMIDFENTFARSDNMLTIKTKFISPYSMEKIEFSTTNAIEGDKYSTDSELKWAANQKINLDASVAALGGPAFDAELRFTSPFYYTERLVIAASNTKKGRSWKTHGDFEYFAGKQIKIDTELSLENQKMMKFEMNTPQTGEVSFLIEGKGRKRDFTIESEFKNEDMSAPVKVSLQADTKVLTDMEVRFDLTSPFRAVRKVSVSAKHVKSGYRYNSDFELDYPGYEVTASNKATFRGLDNFGTTATAETSQGHKAEFSMKYEYQPKNIHAEASLSLPMYRPVSINVDHQGSWNSFTTNAEVGYSTAKLTADISSTINLPAMSFSGRFTSPYPVAERVNFGFNHKGHLKNFENDFTFELNGKKIDGNTKFSLKNWNVDTRVNLATPFRGFESIVVNVNNEMDSDTLRGTGSITLGSKSGNIVVSFSKASDIVGKLELSTPFQSLNTFKAEFTHSYKGWNNFENNGMIVINNDRYSAESDFKWFGQKFTLIASARVPKLYKFVMKNKGSRTNFDSTVTIQADGKESSVTSSFLLNKKLVKGSMVVETPYRDYNKFEAEFEHAGNVGDFKTTAAVKTPVKGYKKFDIELTHKGNLADFDSSVKINLPFRQLSVIEATYKHLNSRNNPLRCDATFKYNDKSFTGMLEFKNMGAIEFKTQLTTPFPAYNNFEVAITHEGDLGNFKTTVDVKTPFRGYETWTGELSHEKSAKGFTTTAKLETSFMSPMEFTVSHTGDYYSMNSRASATYGNDNYNGDVIYMNDGQKIEANYKVNIPNYDDFGLGFVHEGHRNDFTTSINANYGRKEYGTELGFKNTNRKTEGSFTMNMPYAKYRKLGAEFSHEGDMSDFTSTGKANVFGKTVSGTQTYKNNGNKITSNSKVETSYPGYDNFELDLMHNNNRNGRSASATVNTPFRNHNMYSVNVEQSSGANNNFDITVNVVTPMESVTAKVSHEGSLNNFKTSAEFNRPDKSQRFVAEITHRGNMNDFQTTLTVETPFDHFRSNEVSITHKGYLTNFNTQVSYTYDGHRTESGTSFNYARRSGDQTFDFTLTMTTPLDFIRDINVAASHKRLSDVKSGYLRATHNGMKKVDMEYNYNTGAAKSLKVSLKEPRTYDLDVNFRGNGAQFNSDATFNWNPRQSSSSVRVDFGAKNEQGYESFDREFSLMVTLPKRVVGSTVKVAKSSSKYASSASFQWNNGNKHKVSYEIEINRAERRSQKINDGKFGVNTPLGEFKTVWSHKVVPGRQYNTEIQITMDETLTVKNDLTFDVSSFTHSLAVSHPSFTRDVKLESRGTITDKLYDGSVTIEYARESITFNGKIADESDSYNTKYTTEASLKYPRGEVDISHSANVVISRRKAEFNTEFKYLKSTDRQFSTSTLVASYDRVNREINVEVVDPINQLTLKASESLHDEVNGIHRYTAEVSYFARRYTVDLETNAATSSFEVVLANQDNDLFKVHAQYVDLKNMNYDIYHETNGKRTKDVSIALNKQVDGLVKGQIYVRPDILDDIQGLEFSGLGEVLSNINSAIDEIIAEIHAKKSAMRSATEPIANAIEKISNDLAKVAKPVSKSMKKMWKNDEYGMRSTYYSAVDYYEMALDEVYANIDKLNSYLEYAKDQLELALNEIELQMSEKFIQAMDRVKACLERMKPQIYNLRKNVAKLSEEYKEWAMTQFDRLRQHPYVQSFIEKAMNFNTEDYMQPIRRYQQQVQATYEDLNEKYGSYFSGVRDLWNNVGRRQEVRDVVKMIKSAIQTVKEAYSNMEVEKNIREMMGSLNTISVEEMYEKAYNWVNDYLQLHRNRITAWEVNRGNVEFEVFVPMHLPDLKSIPKVSVDVKKYFNRAAKMVNSYVPESDWVFWDTYYKYKPSMKLSDWVPPFSAHASLFGNQHYKTFDHSFVEFAGQCSYLLAHDFINDVYSVVVNYDSSSNKKSIIVTSNKKAIEIYSDGRMTVDGVRTEMPYINDHTTIVRENTMIKIKNTNGVDVECDLAHDRCTVYTTGWYYGKTGGMFGTYDNEKFNDMITSDNRITSNVEDFADSWSSGRRCRSVNRANVAEYSPYSRSYDMCAKYFKNQDSPFRPCFRQAEPEVFMKMCMNELANTNDVVKDSDVCNVISHYIHECGVHGVPLRMPTMCVTCKFNNGKPFPMGPSATLEGDDVPASADVVFVVQHTQNNKNVIKDVKNIIDDLDKALKTEGLVKNMYGLVGYGGHMDEPHTHTMDGQIMNTRDNIINGLNELDFEESDVEADTMAALMFAANYPFRTGVSKTIILIPSDKCTEKTVRYTHIQQILMDRDIRLHMLLEHEFTLKSNSKNPKTAYIFGSDKDGVFTQKHVNEDELESYKDLRRQVALPKDICAALTEDTDGSVFSSQQLINNKPNMQKKFIDVLVRVVADKAEPSACQICDCQPDAVGAGFSTCRSCEARKAIYEIYPEFTDFEIEDMEKQLAEEEKEEKDFELDFEEYIEQPLNKPNKDKKAIRALKLKQIREERKRKNFKGN